MSIRNTQFMDFLVRTILSLENEDRKFLLNRVQYRTESYKKASSVDLKQLFQEIENLEPDPNKPTEQEIVQEVKKARQELWARK